VYQQIGERQNDSVLAVTKAAEIAVKTILWKPWQPDTPHDGAFTFLNLTPLIICHPLHRHCTVLRPIPFSFIVDFIHWCIPTWTMFYRVLTNKSLTYCVFKIKLSLWLF